jgi:hypothetical protein
MLALIFLFLFGAQDGNQAEIGRLQSEVSRLSSELSKTQAVLQAETRPFCSAEIHVQGSVQGALPRTEGDAPLSQPPFDGQLSGRLSALGYPHHRDIFWRS